MAKFQPGQSGNPAGGPKGARRGRYLAPALRSFMTDDPKRIREFMESMFELAKQGNPKAIETIRAALDGPEIKQFNITELTNEQILELLAQGDEVDDSGDEADSESTG